MDTQDLEQALSEVNKAVEPLILMAYTAVEDVVRAVKQILDAHPELAVLLLALGTPRGLVHPASRLGRRRRQVDITTRRPMRQKGKGQ